jgi:uncharacterized protein (TIGR03067 family)
MSNGNGCLIGLLVVSIGLLLTAAARGAADGDNTKPDDAKTIQGMWVPIKAELAGRPMPDAVLKTISLKLTDGKYEVFVGDSPDRGTYTLDPAAQPKSITVTGTEGPNQGKTFPSIYELKHDDAAGAAGDSLRICYDLSGEKRPTEFKTAAGTKPYLVTYRRKKD